MATKSRAPVSELSAHLGYHLRAVSNAVSHAFARRLLASGVTVAEWVLLRELYSVDDKTSPGALAEKTGLTRGAVSKLLDRLVDKDLVIRVEAEGDRRYQELTLSPEALKLVPKLARIADANDEEFFSVLSEPERTALRKILLKMTHAHRLTGKPIE